MLTADRENKLIKLCQDLIRAAGSSGKEEAAVKTAKSYMEQLGFDQINIDKYGSITGMLKGSRPGKKILLDSHIDTVTADKSAWSTAPYGGEIKNGKIYGRGSSDMKGALAAMIMAGASLAKDTDFTGEIYVTGTVHEEIFEGVAAREISKAIAPDFVIIGEASGLKLMQGQRGRAEIVVETDGISSHSSSPKVGRNAVYDMAELITEIRKLTPPEDKLLGQGILELTDIKSSPYPGSSVVPDNCRVTYDRRLLVGESRETVLKQINNLIEKLNLNGRAYFAEASAKCWTGNLIEAERFFPAWILPEDHELIRLAETGISKAEIEPELSHYSFCTNGSHYAAEAGIPTIGFGPSREELAHTADEYIEIDQLIEGFKGYYFIIKEILK